MDYQLGIENIKLNSCAFTGHRDFIKEKYGKLLEKNILGLIENGVNKFYCGMAVGFDLCAAETVINFKEKFDIKLVACVPCPEQDKYFPVDSKKRYRAALSKSDEVVTLAPFYFSGCMQQRDRYMADNCDVLLCYLSKNAGGTFYTVNYAKKQGKFILNII